MVVMVACCERVVVVHVVCLLLVHLVQSLDIFTIFYIDMIRLVWLFPELLRYLILFVDVCDVIFDRATSLNVST